MIQEVLVPILIAFGCGIRCFPGLWMGLSPCNPMELRRDPAPPKTPGLLLAQTPKEGTSGFIFSAAAGAFRGRAAYGRCLFLLALLRAAVGNEPWCRQLSPLPWCPRGAGRSGEQGHLALQPAGTGILSRSVGSTRE